MNLKTLTHPWSRLTLRDGRVVQGTTAENAQGYLELPEIRIAAKKEARASPDGVRTAFAFTLNQAPDAPWRHFFDENIADVPADILRSELKVAIDQETLTIFCLPAHLEKIYGFVKRVIERTNSDYKRERAEVCRRLEIHGQTAEVAAMDEKNKIEAARQQFDKLQL